MIGYKKSFHESVQKIVMNGSDSHAKSLIHSFLFSKRFWGNFFCILTFFISVPLQPQLSLICLPKMRNSISHENRKQVHQGPQSQTHPFINPSLKEDPNVYPNPYVKPGSRKARNQLHDPQQPQ